MRPRRRPREGLAQGTLSERAERPENDLRPLFSLRVHEVCPLLEELAALVRILRSVVDTPHAFRLVR